MGVVQTGRLRGDDRARADATIRKLRQESPVNPSAQRTYRNARRDGLTPVEALAVVRAFRDNSCVCEWGYPCLADEHWTQDEHGNMVSDLD